MKTWICSKKDDLKDPMREFYKINQLLPKKCDQNKLGDCASEIEGTLNWMRNKGLKPDNDVLPGFENLGMVPV